MFIDDINHKNDSMYRRRRKRAGLDFSLCANDKNLVLFKCDSEKDQIRQSYFYSREKSLSVSMKTKSFCVKLPT